MAFSHDLDELLSQGLGLLNIWGQLAQPINECSLELLRRRLRTQMALQPTGHTVKQATL
jgi:hypothetical protein